MNSEDEPSQSPRPHRVVSPPRGVALDFREMWVHRELLAFLASREVKVRYKQTVIGIGWAIIQPVFIMIVFTLFFGRLARIPSQGLPYPVFYLSGIVPWIYFSNALTNATNTMVENQRLITKVYFPRIFLPLSVVLAGLVDFGIAFVILLILASAYGYLPGPGILMAFPLIFLLVATAFGAGLWLSALNAIYRDVRYAVAFLIQLWLFASPVAYPSTLVPEQWRWLYNLNPIVGIIDGLRWSIFGGLPFPLTGLLISGATVTMVIGLGLAFFQKKESLIVDLV